MLVTILAETAAAFRAARPSHRCAALHSACDKGVSIRHRYDRTANIACTFRAFTVA